MYLNYSDALNKDAVLYRLRLNYRASQNMMLDENYTVYNVFIYYVEV